MSLEQDPPPDLMGASPSPFRSLSLVLRGFCDPDAVQEEEDDDDAYPSKDDVPPKVSGGPDSRTSVSENVKEIEQNLGGRPRRVIIPEAASFKVPKTKITENPRQEPVEDECKEPTLTKSNQTRSAPITMEISKPVASTTVTVNKSEPIRNGTKATKKPPPEEAFRGLNMNIQEATLPEKTQATKVSVESGKKKRTSRIVETLFFSLLAVAITIYFLHMLGLEAGFSLKPFVPSIDSSSPLSISDRDAKVDKARQSEDIIDKESSEKSTNYKPTEEEEELKESIDNVPGNQKPEEMEHSYNQEMKDSKTIDDEKISSQEQEKSEPIPDDTIDEEQDSVDEPNDEEERKEPIDDEPGSQESEESEAIQEGSESSYNPVLHDSKPIDDETMDEEKDSDDNIDIIAEDTREERSDEL